MLPDLLDSDDANGLLRAYEAKLTPPLGWRQRLGPYVGALLVSTYCGGAFAYLWWGWTLAENEQAVAVLGVFAVLGALVGEALSVGIHRRRVRRARRKFERAPSLLYDLILEDFTTELHLHRARLLGPDSEWALNRAPLESAADEASRLAEYWRQRAASPEPGPTAGSQLALAESLEAKFKQALQEVDLRSQALRDFLNKCEAKILVLTRERQDLIASQKLSLLSERAESLVQETQESIQAMAAAFLADAVKLGHALGSLQRLGLETMAAESSLEDVEAIADRIIESAEDQRTLLSRLASAVAE